MKEFITSDLYLSAGLSLLLDMNPTYKVDGGRVLFVFPASDELYESMNDFNNGKLLSGIDYAHKLRRLRAEMYAVRNESEG